MTAAVQALWADQIAATLAAAGAGPCVVSPGSRSTPLVLAFARAGLELMTLVDERAAAFFALGAARATGRVVVLACTSGSATAHYLPAIVEASAAGVPLLALTADRPPELHACGASQTIDQRAIYGGFVRAALDLGAPAASELALRAVRRTILQAIACARGPVPGPVHVNVPLRKPLEPAAPSTDAERALASVVDARPIELAVPRLAPDPAAIAALARAVASEPHGVIVAGATPLGFAAARARLHELARLTGYPVIAETGSQLRCGDPPVGVVRIDHLDVMRDPPAPRIAIQLGAEPVAAAWPAFAARIAKRWVLAPTWHDPDATAQVVRGDPAASLDAVVELLAASTVRRAVERAAATLAWRAAWQAREADAAHAVDDAIAAHPTSETALVRAALAAAPAGALIQVGNSLPIRVVDHACAGLAARGVLTQRGAAGIDGLIASAAGATRGGPVLLVLGDVSFAHDLGGLVAARAAAAPLAIVVVDNAGGQIFAGLPVAGAAPAGAFARHWLTAPELDPVAIAAALGLRAVIAPNPAAAASAIERALATPGATVIHAPVAASGAHDVRRFALAHQAASRPLAIGGSP